eukprot:CAMPEP_0113666218 /NCGR_PEP_ID=MMETSP0038_2-20120614/2744_1 /TAXON_ID=2898 /ORGANISM="Cryptomonas paramecium" /LENGTH=126 /DNA_ID=CAMNT_0000581669 /DNA_START=175 /DNA_END=551 /DNA_ORIENTATION=- /assembly_acc=CAM_ASM_000170
MTKLKSLHTVHGCNFVSVGQARFSSEQENLDDLLARQNLAGPPGCRSMAGVGVLGLELLDPSFERTSSVELACCSEQIEKGKADPHYEGRLLTATDHQRLPIPWRASRASAAPPHGGSTPPSQGAG